MVVEGFQLTMEAGTIFSPQPGDFYYTLDGSEPRLAGGDISPTAIRYDTPVQLTTSGTVRARVKDGDSWSAVTEAFFYVNAAPARSDNVVVSEIMYHPENDPDAEFIELRNASNEAVHLRELRFQVIGGEGVYFDFSEFELEAGEVIVVAKDADAFMRAYGPDTPLGGIWSGGSLSNSGEAITLKLNGITASTIDYNDRDPWPTEADGQGMSLTLVDQTWQAKTPSPGVANSLEPQEPTSFVITSAERSNGRIRIRWPKASGGETDHVEFSTSLDGPWQRRPAESADQGLFEDPVNPSTPRGFYRVVRSDSAPGA